MPDVERNERKRLNLDLSPQAYKLLQELADSSGKSMSEILRTGLALYGIAQEAEEQGGALGVVKDKEVMKEVIIPRV